MKTSDHLVVGSVYTREQLSEMFHITDATIKTGIFRPKGHDSVWLFVTENKTADRTQYEDKLVGDELYSEGQNMGRTDHLVIDSDRLGLELLLFYRKDRWEHPGAGFRYEGPFRYVSSTGTPPRRFHLTRATDGLRYIKSLDEIRASLWHFNAGAKENAELAKDLLPRTDYWVLDPDTDMFGPGKFVGFLNMDFQRYRKARDHQLEGSRFDGHATMLALKNVVGQAFVDNDRLVDPLVEWGEELLGAGAFGRANRDKWRFVTLPAASTAKTPDEKEYDAVQRSLDRLGELDAKREGLVRTEQALLRKLLFGAKAVAECVICRETFPVELLVAAHIKRRSLCSRGEKGLQA